MSAKLTHPFETAVQTSNVWLNDLMHELGWDNRHRAYRALRTVLHALRDRLTVEEAADLGAQLPMVIRGLYYDGWTPNANVLKRRRHSDFLEEIGVAFRNEPEIFPEAVVWGVFRLLQKHVSPGEIGDVVHMLPAKLQNLWPGVPT